MQVFHTAGVPPSHGSRSLPTMGWAANSRTAPTKTVMVNTFRMDEGSAPSDQPPAPESGTPVC
jgi:hypothetical protein